MVDSKELREGVSLGGLYTLEYQIRQDRTGTFFAAVTYDGDRLLIKVTPADEPDADQHVAAWQRARRLRHPHLLEMRDVGRDEVAGVRYVYAVFEFPDDVLASALEKAPLTQPETRDVLEAALGALRHLHENGLVHGRVDADHIVAIGETVKLMTDDLGESSDPEAQAEDVRQLGELVLSLRKGLPLAEPLAAIARNATVLETARRWTLAEITDALEAPVIPPAAFAGAAPVSASQPATPASPSDGFPIWIIAGVAVLLAGILALNLRHNKPEVARVAPPTRAVAPPPAPVPQATPAPPPRAAVERPAPSPVHTAPPPPSSPATWRVIAFTYRSRDIAANKAKQLNTRWPDLHASVFSPRTLQGYYLVALGTRMTREDAVHMQRKVRGMGLPRDTFVQNYNE